MSKILEQLNNCPNCGGTLNEFGRCNFCGSKVYDFTSIEFDGSGRYYSKPTYIKIKNGSHIIIAPVIATNAEIEWCSEATYPELRANFIIQGDVAMIDITKEEEDKDDGRRRQ